MKYLIIYDSVEGHSRTIGDYIRESLEIQGHEVSLFKAPSYQVVHHESDFMFIIAPMHAGTYPSPVKTFILKNEKILSNKNALFISVSLTAAGKNEEHWDDLKKKTNEFLSTNGWNNANVEYLAGALKYSKYNFVKRWFMKRVAKAAGGDTDTSRDYIYTDWSRVDQIIGNSIQSSSIDQRHKTQTKEHAVFA